MGGEGPQALGERPCIACGQCVAICPVEALDHLKAPLKNQVPLARPALDAETAARFLRSRRSIRRYQAKAAPREKIRQLLDVARLAPSGGNSQSVSFLVIDDGATLRAISEATIRWMEEQISQGADSAAAHFSGSVERYRKDGEDTVLRHAPGLILALAPAALLSLGRDNAHFALSYAELYAPSLGLGTCWTGYLEACATTRYQPLLKVLKLPEGMAVCGGLMVGVPVLRYYRLPDRNPLQVSWR
jgi:nitroreductase